MLKRLGKVVTATSLVTTIIMGIPTLGFAEDIDKDVVEEINQTLDCDLISEDEIPENVIPLKFDNLEDAEKYLQLEEEMIEQGKCLDLSVNEIIESYDEETGTLNMSELEIDKNDFSINCTEEYDDVNEVMNAIKSDNTATKSKSKKVNAISKINITAAYTYGNKKFKSVKRVSSSYTGVTYGNDWKQDNWSAKILLNGKYLSVNVIGHYDHYILLNVGFLRVASSKAQYGASWWY